MKRLEVEDYMKTLEFESVFKELKLIGFSEALENAKKSSESLLYEIALNLAINEAKSCIDACLSVGNKILQQQEEVARYFGSEMGGVKRKLCQMLEDDDKKIKEIEEFHCIVDQNHRDLLSKLKEAREEEEEKKTVEKKLSKKIEEFEKIQKKIGDSEGIIKSVESLYEQEKKKIREIEKKKICSKKKFLSKNNYLIKNFEKDFDASQKFEDYERLSKEKMRINDEQIELFKSLEIKSENLRQKKEGALQDLKGMNEKLVIIKEEYAAAEQKSIEMYENLQGSQKLHKQNKANLKVYMRKLEITLMENEDIKTQHKLTLKLSKISQKRAENYETRIVFAI